MVAATHKIQEITWSDGTIHKVEVHSMTVREACAYAIIGTVVLPPLAAISMLYSSLQTARFAVLACKYKFSHLEAEKQQALEKMKDFAQNAFVFMFCLIPGASFALLALYLNDTIPHPNGSGERVRDLGRSSNDVAFRRSKTTHGSNPSAA